jgi:hypothetical protein
MPKTQPLRRFMMVLLVSALPVLATACQAAFEPLALRCDITLTDLSPSEARPGMSVTATSTPMTTTWDTAIYVRDVRAPILRLGRDQCDVCDECRSINNCTACSDCDACADTCRNSCVETVTFSVPSLSAGQAEVSIYNRHGQSNPLPLSVVAAPDTGIVDTGLSDSGTGSGDTGDSGTVVLDTADSGVVIDSGSTDSGVTSSDDTSSP